MGGLPNFSKLLRKIERENDIYRVGSDEFAIALTQVSDIKKYTKNLYIKLIDNRIFLKELEIAIEGLDLKIGMAMNMDNLFQSATFALKEVKRRNEKIYKATKKDITRKNEAIKQAMNWSKIIRKALEEDKFEPFYQPIVDEYGRVIKYEVLMRLNYKNRYILPSSFLKIAKKNLQYISISKSLFLKINKNISVSFNISLLDIENEEMRTFLLNKIKNLKTNVAFTLEILESERVKDFNMVKSFIDKLRSYGVKIAIDDFGSGYSNFSRVIELAPEILKIDGSLIRDINIDSNKQKIVKSIVLFAKEVNIQIVAEYVENEQIFNICKSLGVDYYQGFYFSKPKSIQKIINS